MLLGIKNKKREKIKDFKFLDQISDSPSLKTAKNGQPGLT